MFEFIITTIGVMTGVMLALFVSAAIVFALSTNTRFVTWLCDWYLKRYFKTLEKVFKEEEEAE